MTGWMWAIARRLRPAINTADDSLRTLMTIEVLPVIFTGPFALAALIWLSAVTKFSVFSDHAALLAGLLVALAIMETQQFIIFIPLGDREMIPISGTISGIIGWGAALLFGPTVIWLAILARFFAQGRAIWTSRHLQRPPYWQVLSGASQELGAEFGALAGLAIYRAAGGSYPFSSLDVTDWLPAAVASLVAIELPLIIILPLVIMINRLGGQGAKAGSMARWWAILGLFSLASTGPGSLLAALIYVHTNATLLLMFAAGVVVVNALLFYLSRTNERSQQRARELARLETLGEALIQAPPDLSTLPALLDAHVEAMFPQDRLEIRLFPPNGELPAGLRWPQHTLTIPKDRPPVPDTEWERLRQSPDPTLSLSRVIPPGIAGVYGDAVLVKIMADDPGEEGGAKERLLGGICLLRHPRFGKPGDSLAAVQSLASQIGSAFYRAQVNLETLAAEKMARELELAGRIQARFLPRGVPDVWGWDIAAALDPARQTSGDFYDFIRLDNGHLGLVIADVADKGTGAALYMALSRTLIRTFALQHLDAPARTLSAANARLLTDAESDQFVTAFYSELSPLTGLLTYGNAGHNPPYLLRAGGSVPLETLGKTGVPLGIFEGQDWQQSQIQMEPGDVLVLYTDGLSEAQNERGEEFGTDRLLDTVLAHRHESAEEIHAALIQAVTAFVAGAPQFDDLTIMIVIRQAPVE